MMPAYRFAPTDDEEAREISRWHYQPPYDFYDWTNDPDDLEELLDPARREGSYFSASDAEGNLVGFFQFETAGQTVDVGLGLRPDLTGRGLGPEYLLAGLEFARERFSPERFTLSVATFNERAIAVYERCGFRRGAVYMHHTNGADHPFLAMARKA
jgi:[ribosomal protein S18]-alanine N-acetyltransferase